MNRIKYVGYEVLTAVVMRNSTFWDIMLCSLLKLSVLDEHVAPIFKVKE
jgi:hypothetical protein